MTSKELMYAKYGKNASDIIEACSRCIELPELDSSLIKHMSSSSTAEERENYVFSVLNILANYDYIKTHYYGGESYTDKFTYKGYIGEQPPIYPEFEVKLINNNWYICIVRMGDERNPGASVWYSGPYSSNGVIFEVYSWLSFNMLDGNNKNIKMKKRLSLDNFLNMRIVDKEVKFWHELSCIVADVYLKCDIKPEIDIELY